MSKAEIIEKLNMAKCSNALCTCDTCLNVDEVISTLGDCDLVPKGSIVLTEEQARKASMCCDRPDTYSPNLAAEIVRKLVALEQSRKETDGKE